MTAAEARAWGPALLRVAGAIGLGLLVWMALGTGLLVGRGVISAQLRPMQAGGLLLAVLLALCYWPATGRHASSWRRPARFALAAAAALAALLVAVLYGWADPGNIGAGSMLASAAGLLAILACAAAGDPRQPSTGNRLVAQLALTLYVGAAWCFAVLAFHAAATVGQGLLPSLLLALVATVAVLVPWLEQGRAALWPWRPQRWRWAVLALLVLAMLLSWLAGRGWPRLFTLAAALAASAGFALYVRLDERGR